MPGKIDWPFEGIVGCPQVEVGAWTLKLIVGRLAECGCARERSTGRIQSAVTAFRFIAGGQVGVAPPHALSC